MSGDGLAIKAAGIDPLGETEAWIAVIPEPFTALLFSLGVAGIVARRRN